MVTDKNKALVEAEAPKTMVGFALQFGRGELELIKQSKTPGSTQEEFNLFVYDCQARGLNPLKNEIHWIKRGGKATHQVGIDGLRIIAQRSGEYGGQTKPDYGKEINYNGVNAPEWAEVGIYRKGCDQATYARAYFKEYVAEYNGKVGNVWAKMPYLMIAKCAEALALRKAFPDCLAGLYTNEEMAQADNPAPKPVATKEQVMAATIDANEDQRETAQQAANVIEGEVCEKAAKKVVKEIEKDGKIAPRDSGAMTIEQILAFLAARYSEAGILKGGGGMRKIKEYYVKDMFGDDADPDKLTNDHIFKLGAKLKELLDSGECERGFMDYLTDK